MLQTGAILYFEEPNVQPSRFSRLTPMPAAILIRVKAGLLTYPI